jgi:hypothetical protein
MFLLGGKTIASSGPRLDLYVIVTGAYALGEARDGRADVCDLAVQTPPRPFWARSFSDSDGAQ